MKILLKVCKSHERCFLIELTEAHINELKIMIENGKHSKAIASAITHGKSIKAVPEHEAGHKTEAVIELKETNSEDLK